MLSLVWSESALTVSPIPGILSGIILYFGDLSPVLFLLNTKMCSSPAYSGKFCASTGWSLRVCLVWLLALAFTPESQKPNQRVVSGKQLFLKADFLAVQN
jgi:uncharacterized membrane protein